MGKILENKPKMHLSITRVLFGNTLTRVTSKPDSTRVTAEDLKIVLEGHIIRVHYSKSNDPAQTMVIYNELITCDVF